MNSTGKMIADLERLIAKDATDTRPLLRLAELYSKVGSTALACDTYSRAGDILIKGGFVRRALACFSQALSTARSAGLVDRIAPIARAIGTLYVGEKLVLDAVATLDSAARFLIDHGADAQALGILEARLAVEDSSVARIRLAEALIRVGDTHKATEELLGVFRALSTHNRRDEALEVAERLLGQRRDAAIARTAAELYLARNREGDAFLALAKLRICCDEDPTDLPTLELLAKAFELAGHADKAFRVRREVSVLIQKMEDEPKVVSAPSARTAIAVPMPLRNNSASAAPPSSPSPSRPAESNPAAVTPPRVASSPRVASPPAAALRIAPLPVAAPPVGRSSSVDSTPPPGSSTNPVLVAAPRPAAVPRLPRTSSSPPRPALAKGLGVPPSARAPESSPPSLPPPEVNPGSQSLVAAAVAEVDAGWDDIDVSIAEEVPKPPASAVQAIQAAPPSEPAPVNVHLAHVVEVGSSPPESRLDPSRASFWPVEEGPSARHPSGSIYSVSVAEVELSDELPSSTNRPTMLETALECIESLMSEGRYEEASDLVERHLESRPQNGLLLECRTEIQTMRNLHKEGPPPALFGFNPRRASHGGEEETSLQRKSS